MKELFSAQNLSQVSIAKDATHLHVNFIDDEGMSHAIKIPFVNNNFNVSNDFESKRYEPLNTSTTRPTIVRIERTEDGRQREIRSATRRKHRKQSDHVPFTRKLNEAQVREIKALLADKQYMNEHKTPYKAHKELGDAYGVNYMTIKMIDIGVTWKHVS